MLKEFHEVPDEPRDDEAVPETAAPRVGDDLSRQVEGPGRAGEPGKGADGRYMSERRVSEERGQVEHEQRSEDGLDERGDEATAVDETATEVAAVEDPAEGGEATGMAAEEPFGVAEPGEPSHWPRRSGAEAGASAARAAAGGAATGPPGEGDFGAWLRRQRELREIDLREIADKTKISLRYLKAMEQDRFEVLPAPVFARGFLREYAKYVGLDADEVVNYYLAAHQTATVDEEEAATPPPVAASSWPRGLLLTVLLLVVAAALVYLFLYQRDRNGDVGATPPPIAAPVASSAPPRPVPAADETVEDVTAAAPSAPLVVTLDFTEECWVEAQVDGAQRISRLFVAGESLQLEAERQVVFDNLGNVGGVEVQVNGRPFDVGRGSGRTARGVVIDLESGGGPAAA